MTSTHNQGDSHVEEINRLHLLELQLQPLHLLEGPVRLQQACREALIMRIELLAVTGSLCMTLALVLAWCLAGLRMSGFVKRCFPNPQYLLKSHIDFLMMTGLLFIFFLLFSSLGLTPPALVLAAMCLGSIGNPTGFLALAIKPTLSQRPTSAFGLVMVVSFTLTTIGYGGAAWYVALAVMRG